MDLGFIVQPIEKILFYDIETVPCAKDFDDLYEFHGSLYKEWQNKVSKSDELKKHDIKDAFIYEAALYPEFSKIVAISFGYFTKSGDDELLYHGKNLVGGNEEMLLSEANTTIHNSLQKGWILAGHNSNQFDRPFIAKRSFYFGIPCPFYAYASKKPWEVNDIDTMEITKFGSRAGTALSTLAVLLGIPTPKDDMNGREVAEVFYSKKKESLARIATYCGKDVLTVAKIVAKMKNYNKVTVLEADMTTKTFSTTV